jgi:hypothetical protein
MTQMHISNKYLVKKFIVEYNAIVRFNIKKVSLRLILTNVMTSVDGTSLYFHQSSYRYNVKPFINKIFLLQKGSGGNRQR